MSTEERVLSTEDIEVTGDAEELFSPPEPDASIDPAELFADTEPGPVGGVLGEAPRPRFDGDTSRLPAEVCWTLQELVAAPHISDRSRRHWAVVTQYEEILRSRLCELGRSLYRHRHCSGGTHSCAADRIGIPVRTRNIRSHTQRVARCRFQSLEPRHRQKAL